MSEDFFRKINPTTMGRLTEYIALDPDYQRIKRELLNGKRKVQTSDYEKFAFNHCLDIERVIYTIRTIENLCDSSETIETKKIREIINKQLD